MCGIAGIFAPGGGRDPTALRGLAERMTRVIAHRGPDGSGIHIEPSVALGHRRLSIIDVAAGAQPLFNEDGSVAVVFNGEIYNFQQLTTELQAAGHAFRTHSDTEVIVHAWEQWGEACVERFRGMFAFALWDRSKRTLFLARDRLGVKPLYYGFTRTGDLVFGSELKALLQHPELDRALDESAIEDYFAYGYVPDPKSIYQAVRKLPPAHMLTLQAGGTPRLKRYWDVSFEPDHRLTLADAQHRLTALLEESVKLRMISEVPLGAFLSGGVDSSVVVATMATLSSAPVTTCSIGFADGSVDESGYARQVATLFDTNHHMRQVDADDTELLDTLLDCYDEPFADSSAIPTYRVSQLAREHVTVALSGDGGDETFGGYRRYRLHLNEERVREALPLSVRAPLFGALSRVYPKADWAPQMFRAKTTFQALALSSVDAYAQTVSFTRPELRTRLLSVPLRKRLNGYRALEVLREHARSFEGDDPLALLQHLDYRTYLPGDINTKVDRASMAHSLEVREPLMDHELVQWAATIPSSLKITDGRGKAVLKAAFDKVLPESILHRPKQGFIVPLSRWFRGALGTQLQASLTTDNPVNSYIDANFVMQMLEEHRHGRRDWSTPLWTVMVFERFMRRLSTPT